MCGRCLTHGLSLHKSLKTERCSKSDPNNLCSFLTQCHYLHTLKKKTKKYQIIFYSIGATISISGESQCLLSVVFFIAVLEVLTNSGFICDIHFVSSDWYC